MRGCSSGGRERRVAVEEHIDCERRFGAVVL